MKTSSLAAKLNLQVIISALLLLGLAGLYLGADYFFAVSLYPTFTLGYSLFAALICLLLFWAYPLRFKLLLLLVFLGLIIAVRFIPWNSRKPFLADLYRVETGMTPAQVEQIMGKYISGTGWPANPDPAADVPGELTLAGARVYRHTNEGWGNSDWGVVEYKEGHVTAVEFLPD